MKNIHVLPTDKPSRLQLQMNGNFHIENGQIIALRSYENIYITSDEEIKVGDWYLSIDNFVRKADVIWDNVYGKCPNKKIILTTDQDLIKDGVQAIDDEFLEWFVKNPSCEEVDVEKYHGINTSIAEVSSISGNDDYNWQGEGDFRDYKIIIPKEEPKQDLPIVNGSYGCTIQTKKQEPKQETLEEVASILAIKSVKEYMKIFPDCKNTFDYRKGFEEGFIQHSKWQQEQIYSEEKIDKILQKLEEIKIMINIR